MLTCRHPLEAQPPTRMPRHNPEKSFARRPSPAPDPAADHARRLTRACDLELEIRDRRQPLSAPVEWARSGAMALTGPAEGAPRFPRGPLASAARGAGMLLATLAPGTDLAKLDAPALLGEHAAALHLGRRGRVSAGGSARLLPTRDGTLALNLPREDDWSLLPAWLEVHGTGFDPDQAGWDSIAHLIARRKSAPLVDRGRMMGLALSPVEESLRPAPSPFSLHHPSEGPPRRSKRSLRLLDLSNLWAGPLAASLLAMAGIEVLKVEAPERPDGARRGPAGFFDLLNGNKQACSLDLHDPSDRSRFEELLEHADVVLESARPRALEQLGFEAASWLAGKPGRIWASITGHGRSKEWIAFGDDAAMAAGLAWSPEPGLDDPCFCGDAIADPLTGLHMAALVLAHLHLGRGGLLELSLVDSVAHAAALPSPELFLPIEAGRHGWHVLESGHRSPIEGPRARRPTKPAPPLVPPDSGLLSAWARSC